VAGGQLEEFLQVLDGLLDFVLPDIESAELVIGVGIIRFKGDAPGERIEGRLAFSRADLAKAALGYIGSFTDSKKLEGKTLANRGIELRPDPKDLPLGYFLLADLYSRLGDSARSAEYARKGQELSRTK
jgi:hypothetical protein